MRRKWNPILLVACALALLLAAPLRADEDDEGDRVRFRVEVGREVDNDRAVAVMSVTGERREPAQLADRINAAMQWALEQARAAEGVRASSGSYQTYPVYDKNKIVRWRGRQELRLESGDVDRLSRLLGRLQERLQVQSLQFSVSPEKRSRVEGELIEQALAAYQARAEVVSRALGAKGYQLLDISIDTGGRDHAVPLRVQAAALNRAAVEPPAMEAGSSRLTVQVSGSVRLRR
ncbi:MAG TPA: DUF541 domain-containing protein [Gammaproteobacteria bacterium]|nr:DUF541 domain-containing protein [Gammaproteobacteria bacterium]